MADPKRAQPDPEPEPIQGGPTAEPEAAAAPELVAVKYGGREFMMPKDAADAWTSRERDYEQRFSKQGAELGELRTWRKAVESSVQPRREEPKEPDINTLWFENPAEAYKRIKQEVRAEITRDYQQDQALQRFWDGFYRTNDDLREDGWLAQAVFRDHFEDLADLPTVKAQEKLAELTRERILRLTRKVQPGNESTSRPALLEPASGERPARPAPRDDDEGPTSLGDAIRRRSEARRAARTRSA